MEEINKNKLALFGNVIKFDSRPNNFHAELAFGNGIGLSIIRNEMSYGGEEGLFEVAAIKNGKIDYDHPLMDDHGVAGWLEAGDVYRIAREMSKGTI